MARENFEAALKAVLRHEGGFADHPADPGGATMMGVTQATLSAWRGRPVTRDEVRNLDRAEVAEIYRARYWNAVNGDALPAGLDLALFDYAVNSGPARAVRTLQGLIGVTTDGVIGPKTLGAVAKFEPADLIRELCGARRTFLQHLPTAPVFGRGWMRRVSAVEAESLRLLRQNPSRSSQTEGKEPAMGLTKTIFESRTVWANLIGLFCLVLSIFGFRSAEIDPNQLTDKILEAIAALSFIASTIFRVVATKRVA